MKNTRCFERSSKACTAATLTRSIVVFATTLALIAFALSACQGPGQEATQGTAGGAPPSQVQSDLRLHDPSWAPDVKQAVNSFVELYGDESASYDEDSYVVSDFDDTTCIFDIQLQALTYQLETMRFAQNPQVFENTLRTFLSENGSAEAAERFGDWITDIVAAYSALYDTYGPFTARGVSEADQMRLASDPMWYEFASKMLVFRSEASSVGSWMLCWLCGMTEQDVYDITYNSCMKYKEVETSKRVIAGPENGSSLVGPKSITVKNGLTVTDATKELWRVLDGSGMDVWVCSASEVNQIRGAVDAFGLHDYCTGVTAKTIRLDDQGVLLPQYDYETGCGWIAKEDGGWSKDSYPTRGNCWGEGKVEAVQNAISVHYQGKGPLAGFMDATGDFNFCTEFDSLKLVICFNCATRPVTDGGGLVAELALYERDALGYTLETANEAGDIFYVLQGRDENGLRSFRSDNTTVVFGADEPRLFASDENKAQLEYIMEHRLSVSDAFNDFAIAKSADDEGNVFGFDYGFFSDYKGYRSIGSAA